MKNILTISLIGLFLLTNCTKDFQNDSKLANKVIRSDEFQEFINSFINYVDLTTEALEGMSEKELKSFFNEFDNLKNNYSKRKYNDMVDYTNTFSTVDLKSYEFKLIHQFNDVLKSYPVLKVYKKKDFQDLIDLVDRDNFHFNLIYSRVTKGTGEDGDKTCQEECYADFKKRKWLTISGAVGEAALAAAADGPIPVGDVIGMAGAIWALYKGAKINNELLEACLLKCKTK